MTLLVLAAVPFVLAVAGARAAPSVARHAPPAWAAAVLVALALTVSLGTGLLLCLAGFLALVELAPQAWPDDWTAAVIHDLVPVPPVVGIVAGAFGVLLIGSAVVHVVRLIVAARRAAAAVRDLPDVDGLVVVHDAAVHAYAVPGRRARIVVSTGLLRRLSTSERRAVLEHERSHLRHRHHVYTQLARLAAAANPLLRPLARAVDVAVERWADDDAARAVGDRTVVARALGALTLGTAPRTAMGAAGGTVLTRVRYLLEPPPLRRWAAPVVLVVAAVCWVCALAVVAHTYGAIEASELVARR